MKKAVFALATAATIAVAASAVPSPAEAGWRGGGWGPGLAGGLIAGAVIGGIASNAYAYGPGYGYYGGPRGTVTTADMPPFITADTRRIMAMATLPHITADTGLAILQPTVLATAAGDVPIAVELRRVDVAGVNVTRPS